MSTTSIGGFSGTSTYSQDLQNALNRALSIAALPIQQLNATKNTIDSQASELGQLSTLLGKVQTSLQSLASGSGGNALGATVSDSAVLQASLTGGAFAGTYSVQVLDPGSFSSALSDPALLSVSDPSTENISASGSFTLNVNGVQYDIQPATQSLNALAQSINASGAPVQATVINIGSPNSPDYRLAIQSTNLGDVSIQLNDGNADLLDSVTTGSEGSYTVNGQPPEGISTSSRTVTIAPGLNVTLASAGTATVTVGGNTTGIANALSSFVDAYNAVAAELGKNHGQGGGALTGDSSILAIETTLRGLINYAGGSGSVTSLTDLGIEFTQQGTLSFDSSKLNSLSQNDINNVVSFLGDPLTGGFLKAANDALNGLVDPISGLVTSEQQALENRSQQQSQAISDATDRLTQLQNTLTAQMAAADALIASLQQQLQFINGLFQIPTLNSNGTFGNNNG